MYEGTIGEIRQFSGNFAPEYWMYCNGAMMAISNNQALYSIVGTKYGGDGKQTFCLPNIEPIKTVDGQEISYVICVQGQYPRRP